MLISNKDIWMIARRLEDDILYEMYKKKYDECTTIKQLQDALLNPILPIVKSYVSLWYTYHNEDDAEIFIAENNLLHKILQEEEIVEFLEDRLSYTRGEYPS